MNVFKDLVDRAMRDMLIHVMNQYESKHIMMISAGEIHYLEPGEEDFKCFRGVEALKRNELPEVVTPVNWRFEVCDSIDEVLDIFNYLIKGENSLSSIPEAEVVD